MAEALDDPLGTLADLLAKQDGLVARERQCHRERTNGRVHIDRLEARLSLLQGQHRTGRAHARYYADSLMSRVQRVLEEHPNRTWTVGELCEELCEPRYRLRRAIAELAKSGRAQRVEVGVYKALSNALGPSRDTAHKKQRAKYWNRIVDAIEAEPEEVWTARRLVEARLIENVTRGHEALDQLSKRGRIKRLAPGRYASKDGSRGSIEATKRA